MKSFASYHPAVLMSFFLTLIFIAMFIMNPFLQLSALFGGLLFSLALFSARANGKNILFYTALFIILTLFNPLFSHNGETPLFFLNSNPVTLEAFAYGAGMALMLISVLIWCSAYSEIMTSDKFLYLFARSVPKLSLALSMALRFAPLYRRQMKKVSRAQKAMGLYSEKSRADRIKSVLRVLSSLITWSFENALETSQSMSARGYSLHGRSNFSIFRFSRRDIALLAVNITLALLVLFSAAGGAVDFYYYPSISAAELTPLSGCAYAAFFMLAVLPFFNELKENLKWKYYKSKI